MLNRRAFLLGAISAAAVEPLAVRAQQVSSLPRVGILSISSRESPDTLAPQRVLQQALRDLGYVEGQNVILEYRWADGKVERLRELAAELARLDVDVIIAGSTPGARAAQQATSTIPIVSPAMGDPVGDGLVASLARPGGNVTGSTFLGPNLIAKRLELLKEALPRVARLGILWHPGAFAESTMRAMLHEAEMVAGNLGMRLHFAPVRHADDLGRAFVTIEAERTDALFVFDSVMLFALRPQIVVLATKHRLPSMFNNREAVELGALMSYGVSILDLIRRGAIYVDRIIKGAKPSDLPVEQPTKFDFVINLKTARALGLTIPPSLLLRADEVIE
jgi:ABC-type uncharacterized transport system substrate-binding protein